MSIKGCVGLFLFYLDLELFAKILKNLVSTHSLFTLLLIIQDLNKIPQTLCRHYYEENMRKVSAKNIKILKSMVFGARQSFHFFRQKTWFLRNNRGVP